MFARKTVCGNVALFHDSGRSVTQLPEEWPMVWPIDSDASAYHEHPEGITLPDHEYVKIAPLAPLES